MTANLKGFTIRHCQQNLLVQISVQNTREQGMVDYTEHFDVYSMIYNYI